jgi:hypothetical protein
LLSCRVLRGWISGVLAVLLAEEPDLEAWAMATVLAWSGGTYLYSQKHKDKYIQGIAGTEFQRCKNFYM